MNNYYEILGLKPQAGRTEIKTAFRRLAKIYHPDKNPRDKDVFVKILKAYETLSDPNLKARYDQKLRYGQQSDTKPNENNTKNWRFDERELKRRRYYEEHIQQFEKSQKNHQNSSPQKKSYNEYKYILFATPLAVALFLLIIQLASPAKTKHNQTTSKTEHYTQDDPYSAYFGESRFDSRRENPFTLENKSDFDVIVCVFGEKGFIRSCYLQKDGLVQLKHIPDEALEIRYTTGSHFDPNQLLEDSQALGAFSTHAQFYKSKLRFFAGEGKALTLIRGKNEGFESVSEKEFFN